VLSFHERWRAGERHDDARIRRPCAIGLRSRERKKEFVGYQTKRRTFPNGHGDFRPAPPTRAFEPVAAPRGAAVEAGIRTPGPEGFPSPTRRRFPNPPWPGAVDAVRSRSPLRGSSGFAPDSLEALRPATQMLCWAPSTDTRVCVWVQICNRNLTSSRRLIGSHRVDEIPAARESPVDKHRRTHSARSATQRPCKSNVRFTSYVLCCIQTPTASRIGGTETMKKSKRPRRRRNPH
jgi:hypothetical protein